MNKVQQNSRKTLYILVGIVLFMFGFGFALSPLYTLYCKVTGANGKTYQVEEKEVIQQAESRPIKVRFDTMVNSELPWLFHTDTPTLVADTGKTYEIEFKAVNRANHAIVGQAVPSISPWQGAPYFNKTECFCFEQQTLAAGEERDMVLRFTIDPNIPDFIGRLTLSYTFLNTHKQAEKSSKPNKG